MILDQIVEDKKIRLKEHKNKTSPDEIRRMAEEQVKIGSSFYDALKLIWQSGWKNTMLLWMQSPV